MIRVRKSDDRGRFNFGWLDTRHTFSFGDYYDPQHLGFSALRVINEDDVAAGAGFPTHPHKDMEIITYVLDGELAHKDSLGNGATITPGEVQRMSAGTGIAHSEFNHSRTETVHFLQIWIIPGKQGVPPGYQQIHFPAETRKGQLKLVGADEARDDVIRIHQNVRMYATLLGGGDSVSHSLPAGRYAWLHVAKGGIEVNGKTLGAGDGAAFVADKGTLAIDLRAAPGGEALLFDMA